MASYGRDRHRRLTTEEMRLLYARADGLCQDCGTPLDVNWHGAHMAAYSTGGATQLDQMRAQCPKCNLGLGANDMEQVEGLRLRLWQQQGFEPIIERLWTTGSATLHAAPGAGKTLFAAAIFRRLYDCGLVHRLVIFVPNANLVDQTVEAYARMGIHLDRKPRDGVLEHPDTVGLVVCYQSLSDAAAEAHAVRMRSDSTLVIFDEVHHLAERDHSAWGRFVEAIVGDVASGPPQNATAVFNMTGTLFRSAKSQRISTVRYKRIGDNKFEAIPDWSVPTAQLVGIELRAPDLYVYGGKAKLVDLENEKVIESEIVDLSQLQRSAVSREMFRSRPWLRGVCTGGLRLLKNQLLTLNGEVPLKLLHVADDQRTAKLAADIYNELEGQDIAALVISDEPGSARTLRQIRKDPRPRVIVTCQMVTEGFDCHELSAMVHASRKAAPLFVAQVMARVMRVTDYERAAGMMLPAAILIPDDPVLRETYASALASARHIVEEDDAAGRCHEGHRRSMCSCRYPEEDCSCGPWFSPAILKRFDLLDLEDPRLNGATVLGHEDGDVTAIELANSVELCNRLLIPEPFAPRVAVAVRQGPPVRRKYSEDTTESAETPAGPRDIVETYRARMRQAAGWMEKHIGHDDRFDSVSVFQVKANEAGNIIQGGRDHATARQLATAADWMAKSVREHCYDQGEQVPAWAEDR